MLITGGSSGIGKAAAMLCAQSGAHVGILGRKVTKLDAAVAEIGAQARFTDQKFATAAVDVSDRSQLTGAVAGIVEQIGGIDVLVNSAGITWPGYVETTPDSVWDSMIRTDYMGTVNAVRACLPYFTKQKSGTIVNVSSVCGYMGVFGYAAYAAAKFAVVGLSECLRQDLLRYNIRISVVYPPDTDTPQWHEENEIKPDETRMLAGTIKVMPAEKVARAMLEGASRGKFTIVPGLMNKITYLLNRHAPDIIWKILSGQLAGYWKKNPAGT
ncbi:MAG: SDR family oxidoreductase [Chitinispirillaceae bacterium]|nr:SDR family oxidoreductase [Chitinispirillaceae bacterium]